MLILNSFTIPFTEPVTIIALVMIILLIAPVFFERLRIPSIVGLLISGAIIGPHGFNLLSTDIEFSLLGTMGLLYLMFLAGLEIDLIDFIENRAKSIFIGLVSFIFPFVVGYLTCTYILDLNVNTALLVGAMLSSHTLISYPLLGRLGIVNKKVVTITVGATIIADILALVAMELIVKFAEEGFGLTSLFQLSLNFLVFSILVFVIGPRISKIFLVRYEGQLGVQFVFVMAVLFLSSFIAHLLGIEPIIGAFFSGLILNRQIISNSALYRRVEFVGNNLFIPIFLISIGMLANFKVYLEQTEQIGLALALIGIALASKYIAAIISKFTLRLTWTEGNMIFGLSVSRAASAIAIILVGFNLGIVSESILNSTVILILATSIVSSYVTRGSGKKIYIEDDGEYESESGSKQKFLVPVANPANIKNLLEFAILIKEDDQKVPVYPLTVFTQQDQVREKINENQAAIKKIVESLQTDVHFELGSRIDSSVTDGIVRASDEIVATSVIIGWNTRKFSFHNLFGTILDNLLNKTRRMVVVLKTPTKIRDVQRIFLFCPENAHYEHGFYLWLKTLSILSKKLQIKYRVWCESKTVLDAIKHFGEQTKNLKYFEFVKEQNEEQLLDSIRNKPADLLIFVHARPTTISYFRRFERLMNRSIDRFNQNNIIIIYPEQ